MKKFLTFLVIFAVLAGVFVILTRKSEDSIAVVKPVIGPAVQAVYATGTVEPTVMMPIAPRTTSRLVKLQADEGLVVEKNQVLGQLEDSDIQKQLDELQARADFASKDYSRKAELLKRGAVSKNTADQSKSELEAANAAVARIKAQLGYLQLVAPEAGVVIRRDGEEGEMIPANQPVFWLSCCAPLRVSAEVDEEDVALVKPGLAVVIRADAFPGRTFEGEVTSITPKGDAISRSYRVRIGLDEKTPLMIGMTAETNIVINETKDALLIPTAAVKDGAVWIVADGKLAKREIETGAKTTEATQVLKGLSADDVVVSSYGSGFSEGQDAHTKMTDWKAP